MHLRSITVCAALATLVPSAFAATIDFEDITAPGCCTTELAGYQGFSWGGGMGDLSWVVAEAAAGVFDGMQAHSGDNFAWSNGSVALSLERASFDLVSLWARTADGSFGLDVHGLRGGVELYTRHFELGEDYALLELGFVGVDTVVFDQQPNNVLIDDITVVNAVPEPASGALLLAGAGALAAWRRRRR